MPGESQCTPREIRNYLGRVSGPLLDRIDLHLEVPAVKFQEISSEGSGEPSSEIRARVVTARRRQQDRFRNSGGITCNARMGGPEVRDHCRLGESGHLRVAPWSVRRMNATPLKPAIKHKIPYLTTLAAPRAGRAGVKSLQSYHEDLG